MTVETQTRGRAVPETEHNLCEHIDNLSRWPPVIDLNVVHIENHISDDGKDPSFSLKMSYANYGPRKALSCRFMIYLPLRIRYSQDFTQDVVKRVCAYVVPIACSTEKPDHAIVELYPERREFLWPFERTAEEYSSDRKVFYFDVTARNIKTFICRVLLNLAGAKTNIHSWDKPVHWWNGIGAGKDPGERRPGDDDYGVSRENPDPRERDEGTAKAPFHATFAAHFAEGSTRFPPYNGDKLIRIPITNGTEVWYGCKT